MTNKELEKTIRQELKKKSKDTIIELYLQMKFERDILQEQNANNNQESQHYDFQVGDRVQFKSWEEMEKEFGLDGLGNINCSLVFAKKMKYLCGTYATIDKIYSNSVKLKDFTANGGTDWTYSLDMLKPATDEPKCKFKVGDKVRFTKFNDELNKKLATIHNVEFEGRLVNYYVRYSDEKLGIWVREDEIEPYTEPRWTFTDDEKVILRNIVDAFKWVARDKDGSLFIFGEKPRKDNGYWDADFDVESLIGFNHLFQSIKWDDTEPCEFRKYL